MSSVINLICVATSASATIKASITGHKELQVVLAEGKHLRACYKATMNSQLGCKLWPGLRLCDSRV